MKIEWTARALATNMKFYRAELGLSQRDLAGKAKVSYRLVQELEAGKGNPTIETLHQIAEHFKVTIPGLLQIQFLRLSHKDEHFLERFKREFRASPVIAALRNLDGVNIWANSAYTKLFKSSSEKGPVDLIEFFSDEARGILKQQFAAEKNGHAHPYTFVYDRGRNERLFLRVYPTLILPAKGRTAAFVSVYFTEMADDCTSNYYDYCKLLLTAAYPA